ncbi:CD9 antigen-like [Haliotis rubra]|uniref:CD9 antigen-like n=1 Tax=Haliotis rubra TaxID=36100 RepID=UPI001EE50A9D|nr:CD9 antigen-like [Haliotis rubra]
MCGDMTKCFMHVFNVLFLPIGLGLTGLGIWLRLYEYIDDSDNFNALHAGSYVFIGVGAVIILLAIIGICGTIRRSQCLLVVFFIGLFIITTILLAIGVVVLTQMDVVKESFGDYLMTRVKDNSEESRTYMNNFQNTFNCCGAKTGVSDYVLSIVNLDSQCKLANYVTPCADAFFKTLSPNLKVTAGISFGAAFIMILGMVLSMCFCCAIRKSS